MNQNRGRRDNHRDENHGDEYRSERRPALQWREVEKIQHGYAIGTINSAERDDGTRAFSWCLGKEGRRDDRVMKFLDPRDFKDAHDVIDSVEDWISEEQAAEPR